MVLRTIRMVKVKPKIGIVGCGASGVAAATRLLQHGFDDITILEAQNRIGGRIHSVDFEGKFVDLGAQWCHGEEGNVVYETVKGMNLLNTSYNNYLDNTYYSSSGFIVDKVITDELFGIADELFWENEVDTRNSDIKTFGDYFIQRYNDILFTKGLLCAGNKDFSNISKQFIDWCHKFYLCLDSNKSWFDVPLNTAHLFKECPGDFQLNWGSKGYKTLLDVLMCKDGNSKRIGIIDDKINLNKEVMKIKVNEKSSNINNDVMIECSDETKYYFDHVIVTVSLGVLKHNHKTLFEPQLPLDKINAIEGLSFGNVCKIFLKFPFKWWPDEFKGFSLLWEEKDRQQVRDSFPEAPAAGGKIWLEDVFGFYRIDSHPDILLGWLVGECTKLVETLSDQEVQNGCMHLLEKFVGWKYDIPEPDTLLRSKWGNDPRFFGCYSTGNLETERRQVSAEDLAKPIMFGNSFPILFAGEASHSCYFSTVHGAMETGYREADRIINFYTDRKKSPVTDVN